MTEIRFENCVFVDFVAVRTTYNVLHTNLDGVAYRTPREHRASSNGTWLPRGDGGP